MLILNHANRMNIERHRVELKRDTRRRINRLLHTVAGHVALDELVLPTLTDLEHEEPLAVDLANHRPLAKENRTSSRLCS